MSEMLIINPSHRKRRSSTGTKKRKSSRRRVARAANPIRRTRRRVARRHNPIGSVRRSVMRRGSRRRRNPIRMGAGMNSWMGMLRDAAIGGAGAIAVDLLMGQVNKYLPESMKTVPTAVGVGDAVKAAITIAAGVIASKVTRSALPRKMAQGALTVQAAEIMRGFVPDSMPLGYSSPARLVNRSALVRPMNRYSNGARSPLLQQFSPGSPLVSGVPQSVREGYGNGFSR